MIKIKIFRENNMIKGFEIKGHAFHKSNDEQFDLVCASVSSISQTALLGLIEYVKLPKENQKIQDGYLFYQLPDQVNELQGLKAQAILETMVIGLEDIAGTYSKNIKIV